MLLTKDHLKSNFKAERLAIVRNRLENDIINFEEYVVSLMS